MLRKLLTSLRRVGRAPQQAQAPGHPDQPATLIITHAEICNRHGTGSLLRMTFENEDPLLVFYSRAYFGENLLGEAFHVEHPNSDLDTAKRKVAAILQNRPVRRIFCVPFYPDDAFSALAAHAVTGAPLIMYVMDDQNVFANGIPDRLMKPLVDAATLRFAISETLRSAYQEKFGVPFWVIPPVASERHFAPTDFYPETNQEPAGVLIGNVWSLEALQDLRKTVSASGFKLHWYGNAGKPFINLDANELEGEGIVLHPNLPDIPLIQELRKFDYGIMPSGMLTGKTEHDWLFKASLPSRLIYQITTANLPIIVLGSPETEAARFILRMELGTCCAYEPDAFRRAVVAVTEPGRAREIRERAKRLAPAFRSDSLAGWLWESLKRGAPVDDRYERLFHTAATT
ncbi:MAG: hypothetical protein JO069_03360 [Verrucomicrobia bacterium]|nr:hypothetical protein [Verrucomicrobiota bacterium]